LAIVIEATADAVNNESAGVAELSESTVLIGGDAVVDSLGLVQIITDVEESASERYGRDIDLTDERALSQKNSPFRSVGTLVNHIVEYAASPPAQ